MIYLRSLTKRDYRDSSKYPYCTEVIKKLDSITFDSQVTMLCGDNGSGKSTLIELLAEKCGAHRISNMRDKSPKSALISASSRDFTVAMSAKPTRKMLFTAEAFTRYIDFLYEEKREAAAELRGVRAQYGDTYAGMLAAMPYERTIGEIEGMYENELDAQSHGQGFIDFFASRISGGGLFLLDEPEAALAYEKQLALMYMMRDAAKGGSQFIISTHSPILLAYPDAKIYEITEGELVEKTYDKLDSIAFLKRYIVKHDDFFRDD